MPTAAPDAVKRLVETFDRPFDSLGCKLSGLTNERSRLQKEAPDET
jgi:hypothetical protein